MTRHQRVAVLVSGRPCRRHRGFTLLEVLVSLGIIIGALAGIAALLPAAGSRLADAADIDRAGTLAANARSDLANRRVLTSGIWAGAARAVVFGEGLSALATLAPASSSIAAANLGGQAPNFVLEDSTAGGGSPGVCYGCMLSVTGSLQPPPATGAPVRMTTVVFRRPAPQVQGIALTGTFGQPLVVLGPLTAAGAPSPVTTTAAAALSRQYLAGCSWVLAVSSGTENPPATPRWVQIGSSWTAFGPGQTTGSPTGTSSVMLTGTDHRLLFSGTTRLPSGEVVGSGTLRIFGFDGLLRLDERTVNLE